MTTRIKGILAHGTEVNDPPTQLTHRSQTLTFSVQVELALLSTTESVELLAGVAELDGSQIPPQLLEISQLCGRLPLCLNIVGKLVFVSQITKNH